SLQERFLCEIGFLSSAELALLFAVCCSAYGWLVMKDLITKRRYSPLMVNGIGMLVGGIAAAFTAFAIEGNYPLVIQKAPTDVIGMRLIEYCGPLLTSLIMAAGSMLLLIIIANIICYNLYGYLLTKYSPTFLSFAGFSTPLFASVFGWIFLKEV